MSRLFASLSVGTAWEKLSLFLRASMAASSSRLSPSPSSSSLVATDLGELRKLERTMRRIRATLHDAEVHWNIQEESTKLRLAEFKELASDIEDLVNEYEALKPSTSTDCYTDSKKRKRQEENDTHSSADTAGLVQVPYELVSRAEKLTERLTEITRFSNRFSLSENDGERCCLCPDNVSSSWHTGSFMLSETRILGRDEDRDLLVEKLLSGGEGKNGGATTTCVSVMAIVGTEGLGKTTLAQLVYNDPRTRQAFDKHAWVYVSEHFHVNTITRDIIDSLTTAKRGTTWGGGYYTELADLQEALADELKDQKVLLILDYLWNERGDSWELLCAPLSQARVCQIIVTTRNEAVARLVQTTPPHRPRCLSFDESWSLFKQTAFPPSAGHDDDAPPENIVESVKNVIKEYKRLPLAIKTLAIMLRDTDKSRWEDALEHVLCDLLEQLHCAWEVLPALESGHKQHLACP